MKKSAMVTVAALAIAGGAALERGADATQQQQQEQQQQPGATRDASPTTGDTSADANKSEVDRERARADACEGREKARTERIEKAKAEKAKRAKAEKAKREKEAKAEQEKAKREEEERAAKPRVTVGEHVGRATITSAPGRVETRNTSTTLGDGSSGMYTGGMGTYGGQATWGTGGTTAAPAPAEPAPSATEAPKK